MAGNNTLNDSNCISYFTEFNDNAIAESVMSVMNELLVQSIYLGMLSLVTNALLALGAP